MIIKAKDFDKFLVKFKVELGSYFDLKDDEAFIVFKELDTFNTLKLKDTFDKGETELLKVLKEVLPEVIVEHNFYVDDTTLMNNKELIDVIFNKSSLALKVVGDYINNTFQLSKSKEQKTSN